MAVPYTFGSATTSIPLSQLDSNFATTITLGNTAVQLGNTITNLTGVSNVASATSLSLGSNGNTTAITVDTSQNVGIGTTAPTATLDVRASTGPKVQVKATTGTSYAFAGFSNTGGDFNIGRDSSTGGSLLTGSSAYAAVLNSFGAYPMQFGTNGVLAMTIDSSQNLLVGTTSATGKFNVTQAAAATVSAYFVSSNATTDYGIQITYTGRTPNNSGEEFIYCNDATLLRMNVRSNGGIANFSANNVNLSDQREKKDIELAPNYLDKICQIPVKTFLFNDQTDTDLNLGAIAQDVQAVCPELVHESNWANRDEPEKMRLSIYQTDLQYALMKSIQELKAINDTQAETINALTARIVALEAK